MTNPYVIVIKKTKLYVCASSEMTNRQHKKNPHNFPLEMNSSADFVILQNDFSRPSIGVKTQCSYPTLRPPYITMNLLVTTKSVIYLKGTWLT